MTQDQLTANQQELQQIARENSGYWNRPFKYVDPTDQWQRHSRLND